MQTLEACGEVLLWSESQGVVKMMEGGLRSNRGNSCAGRGCLVDSNILTSHNKALGVDDGLYGAYHCIGGSDLLLSVALYCITV